MSRLTSGGASAPSTSQEKGAKITRLTKHRASRRFPSPRRSRTTPTSICWWDPRLTTPTCERLVNLGATVVEVHDGEDGRWSLLNDPEENEFDLS